MAQSGWDQFWGGADYQIGEDYTTAQQDAASAAFGAGVSALEGFNPQNSEFLAYKNYMSGLNPNDIFAGATSPEQMAQYQMMVNQMTGGQQGSILEQAQLASQEAGASAAEQYNLMGKGALHSGGALSAISRGSAAPLAAANAQIAGLQSQAYQNLLGQNMAGRQYMTGLQSGGYGNLMGAEQNINQMGLGQAQAIAQMYGQQGAGYDTAAMFGSGYGAGDFLNTLTGAAGAAGSIYDRFAPGDVAPTFGLTDGLGTVSSLGSTMLPTSAVGGAPAFDFGGFSPTFVPPVL